MLAPIQVTPGGRYFETTEHEPWLLIGANDAISWPGLVGLLHRRDMPSAERYVADLAAHGITVIRLMLEYCQQDEWYFEQPCGTPQPHMIQLWDDLFGLCERYGLRVLLAPWDNFWMARRWAQHPYNQRNGGPAATPAAFFTDRATIAATVQRLEFVIRRWGRSGVLAAWDLFNEIHPHWGGTPSEQSAVITELAQAVRACELRTWGWSRPQTVSIFGPEADSYEELIFRHPALDFATTHIYYKGAIDHPTDTVAAALTMAEWVRYGIANLAVARPFTDSEHGPIHLFNDHQQMLPEDFDDEYERHLMWAHLASGGAGSGLRWPARHPHVLTSGMKQALASMARFVPLLDWRHFSPQDARADLTLPGDVVACAVRDQTQAVIWLLRGSPSANPPGRLPIRPPLQQIPITLRGLAAGQYCVELWNTLLGQSQGCLHAQVDHQRPLQVWLPELANDLALAIRPV